MTNDEIVLTPMFCLVCGSPVMANCVYLEGYFNVYCPVDDSHLGSRAAAGVYLNMLYAWWDDRHTKYDEERMEDRAIGTRWAR